jgi:hypothetical protein
MVTKRIVNKHGVNEALHNMYWIADFWGALTSRVLLEYLELFQLHDEVVLHQGTCDMHIGRLGFMTVLYQISLQSIILRSHLIRSSK